jgi:predicted phage baseplate assembly protein
VSVPLPTPNLDDRRFQELVDDAKRLVQQRCPEWTDHNVSDPGVTMIELFAWMTDQLLYRLNRVPDRNYVKFLELIGLRLFPPTAARAPITFWLSGPRPDVLVIPAGTEVSTERTEREEAVVFATERDFPIPPCSLARIASVVDGKTRTHAALLESGESFFCFGKVPKPDEALLLGLSDAVPSCAVVLRFDCDIEGVGVKPDDPPVVWEAWTGTDWSPCELDRDETGGLNRAGDVVLHVPADHQASLIANQRAGWLRCRIVESKEDQRSYVASPQIKQASAFTIGGTTDAFNAETIEHETLGLSEGVSGQRFPLKRRPVVAGDRDHVLEVAANGGWREWREVNSFVESGEEDEHFLVDAAAGEVAFGPAVRMPDGTLRCFGAVPPKGAALRLVSYRTGGGRRGNVTRGAITILKSSIPHVESKVENRRQARGGVDGEPIENAKVRGAIALRTGNRAVTVDDYEQLAREAAPEVARIRCVPAGNGSDPGAVRVLVVPAVDGAGGRIHFDQLEPSEDAVEKIARYLDERRVLGARVAIEPPAYQGITVVAKLRARPHVHHDRLQAAALEALYDYFGPLTGGPDGDGWPFGRTVLMGEVYSVLQAVKGTELVEEVLLFAADPTTAERSKPVDRIELEPHALVFGYEHRVLVEE